MEKAFKELGDRYLAHTEHLHSDWKLLREYPLSPQLLAMSHVWQSADVITGDYPETAQTIARQVGLLQTGDTINRTRSRTS